MTKLNLDFKGDFATAETPDKKTYLLPYWLEDRVAMAETIKLEGAFGQAGAILYDDKNIVDVRSYVRPENFERLIATMERESGGAIGFEKTRALDLHRAGQSAAPMLAVKTYVPAPLLPAFAAQAGVEGLRPWQDSGHDEVTRSLGVSPPSPA